MVLIWFFFGSILLLPLKYVDFLLVVYAIISVVNVAYERAKRALRHMNVNEM